LQKERLVESVEVSTIAHATEDLAKVETALRALLPEGLKQREIFTRRYLQGHYGNPIATFEARLTRPAEVSEFVDFFMRLISRNERLRVERDLELHSDSEGNLFVRIDKQQAFSGSIRLGEDDPIRVKMKFTRLKRNAKELMRQLLELE